MANTGTPKSRPKAAVRAPVIGPRQPPSGTKIEQQRPSGPPTDTPTSKVKHDTGPSQSKHDLGPPNVADEWLSSSTTRSPSVRTSFNSSGKGGAAFRPVSETFQVNPANGTFSLAVPMTTSPARSGFTLDLSLSYSSGNGNGPFGFGWSLNLPEIYRRIDKGIPRYNEDTEDDVKDSFALSGTDALVCVESFRYKQFKVFRYRPRVEQSHSRIERWVPLDDPNDVHWRTISTENVTTIFGNSDASRIFDMTLDRKRVFAWRICYSYDTFGNAVQYSYTEENGVGIQESSWESNRSLESRCRQRYLKSISYGNLRPNRDVETWMPSLAPQKWMFEVLFDYGDSGSGSPDTVLSPMSEWKVRKDAFSSNKAGFEVRTYRLCHRISMVHHFFDLPEHRDAVVCSTMLDYEESSRATFLKSVTQTGFSSAHTPEHDRRSESLPPWTFSYNQLPEPASLQLQRMRTSALHALPTSQHRKSEWIDLEGEGIPGLLLRSQGGPLAYQRNLNTLTPDGDGSSFAPPVLLPTLPSLFNDKSYFDDFDGSGRKCLVTVDHAGRLQGFNERLEDGTWGAFRTFPSLINTDVSSPNVFRVDLTGDGLLDLLHAQLRPGVLEWQSSLSKEGFSQRHIAHSVPLDMSLPMTASVRDQTYFADMTGDGYSDIVKIGNGSVTYWPNLGYGFFGSQVVMGNAPAIDQGDQFTHDRVRLLDLDGSGTTDLLYILPGGAIQIYYNLAGNLWSSPVVLGPFPELSSSSEVSVVDLFGIGTGCLCWMDSQASASEPGTLHYLDVMASQKPHLLNTYQNGMGAETAVSYKPSTYYYMRDESCSQPWKSRIPFPVQCVATVETRDLVTGGHKTSTYSYHDGYYDGAEQEFGGFGMVEVIEHEQLSVGQGETHNSVPAMTKYWYSTGSGLELSCTDRTCTAQRLLTHVSSDISSESRIEACRSLRGHLMRVEHYGLDGSKAQHLPYSVSESSYSVRQLIVPKDGASGTFEALHTGSITWHYERDMADPRVEHTLVTGRNDFGDVLRHVQVSYGRTKGGASVQTIADGGRISDSQSQTRIVCTELLYTHSIEEREEFAKPKAWSHRQYELIASPFTKLLGLADLQELGISGISTMEFSALPAGSTLISEHRRYFLGNDLITPLAAGMIEAYSVQDRSFQLCFGPEDSDDLVRKVVKQALDIDESHFLSGHGYQQLGTDARWWLPSSRYRFSDSASGAADLQLARSTFYIPTLSQDPRGNLFRVEMDQKFLLPVATIDALGNTVRFENDYERLRPIRIIDSNQNLEEVRLDVHGNVVATSRAGKDGERVGDSLSDFVYYDDPVSAIDAVLLDPSGFLCQKLLGKAATRTIADLAWRNRKTSSTADQSSGPRVVQISRDASHFSQVPSVVKVSVTFLNGKGTADQEFQFVSTSSNKHQWILSECSVRNAADIPIRTFQPAFVDSARHVGTSQLAGPFCTHLLDSMGRNVGTVNSDATWSKTVYKPWSVTTWNLGDTILLPTCDLDPDLGPIARRWQSICGLSSWSQVQISKGGLYKAAAEASQAYGGTPDITHCDAGGRPIATVAQTTTESYTEFVKYDVWGNVAEHFDRRGRLCERHTYNSLGHLLQSSGMDNGTALTRYDCMGNPVLSGYPSRNIWAFTTYDTLNRELEVHMMKNDNPVRVNKRTTYGEAMPDAEKCNLRGRVWQVLDQAGSHCNSMFDHLGNATRTSLQLAKQYKGVIYWDEDIELRAEVYEQQYAFDYEGRVLWCMDALGSQTRSVWDRLGNLLKTEHCSNLSGGISEQKWTPYITHAEYAADSLPLETRFGNDTTVTCQYDEHTRLSVRETIRGAAGKVIDDTSFIYDCEGRKLCSTRLSDEKVFFNNCIVKPESHFRYDALGRLISATGRQGLRTNDFSMQAPTAANSGHQGDTLGDGSRMCAYEELYSYDITGNITSVRHQPLTDTSVSGWTRRYFYEEPSLLGEKVCNNMLSRTVVGSTEEVYKYEGGAGSKGCMTAMPGFSVLKYNCHGMLAESATTRQTQGAPETTYYVYDLNGERVRKITEAAEDLTKPGIAQRVLKETIYLPGLELFYEYPANDALPIMQRRTSYVKGIDIIASIEQTDPSAEPLVRYIYGPKLELDNAGQLISYEEHSPFGAVTYAARRSDVKAPRSYRFASYLRDAETGLFYCQARYYAAWLGRFTTPDPLGSVDDVNLYQYCTNDPINFSDPSGMIITSSVNLINRAQQRSTSQSRGRPTAVRPTIRFPTIQNQTTTNQTTTVPTQTNQIQPTRPTIARDPSTATNPQRSRSVQRPVSRQREPSVQAQETLPIIPTPLTRAVDKYAEKAGNLQSAISEHSQVLKDFRRTVAASNPERSDWLGNSYIRHEDRKLTTEQDRSLMKSVVKDAQDLERGWKRVEPTLIDDGTVQSNMDFVQTASEYVEKADQINADASELHGNLTHPLTGGRLAGPTKKLDESTTKLGGAQLAAQKAEKALLNTAQRFGM